VEVMRKKERFKGSRRQRRTRGRGRSVASKNQTRKLWEFPQERRRPGRPRARASQSPSKLPLSGRQPKGWEKRGTRMIIKCSYHPRPDRYPKAPSVVLQKGETVRARCLTMRTWHEISILS